MSKIKVLIVDEETGIRFGIKRFLASRGFEVIEAENCAKALEAFRNGYPDIAILDYMLPDDNALSLMPKLKAINPSVPLVILTGHGSIDLAVVAIKEGAEQFLTKPIKLPALLVILERALENRRNRQAALADRSRQGRKAIDPFLGNSEAIRKLAERARRVISSESPILIQGETGSGKGVLARWLHDNGPRASEAFVDLNCAGLSKEFLETELFGHEKGAFTGAATAKTGLFEVAHRGTIFLDEIGDVDPHIQPKLLKALEEKRFRRLGSVSDRQVDARLIAATHQDLNLLIQEKKFRSDLYFRISAIPLYVPPLRERKEDIALLARILLKEFTEFGHGEIDLSDDAVKAMQAYPWPGNIRELRNVLERAALLSDHRILGRRDLLFDAPPKAEPQYADSNATLEENERRHIEIVLAEENGRVEKAAKRLGVSRNSLYLKIKKHGIRLSK